MHVRHVNIVLIGRAARSRRASLAEHCSFGDSGQQRTRLLQNAKRLIRLTGTAEETPHVVIGQRCQSSVPREITFHQLLRLEQVLFGPSHVPARQRDPPTVIVLTHKGLAGF